MHLRQIAQLGAPVLRESAKTITDPDTAFVHDIISDMQVTLADSGGVGLAAPQIYEPYRIIIVASRPTPRYPYAPEMQPIVMINPEYQILSEKMETDWEGCLSIPGIRARVPRYQQISIRYCQTSGEIIERIFEGFIARVFQHEHDHLNGIVYLDRVEDNKNIVTEKEFFKQIASR